MRSTMVVRLGAEALGTLIFLYIGIAAAFSAAGAALPTAAGFLAGVTVAAWIFGAASGGHFNPWISLAAALRGRMSWADAGLYVVAQLLGGIVAALLVWLSYGTAGAQDGLGATRLAPSASTGSGLVSGLVAEAIATFVLITIFFVLTEGSRADSRSTAVGIGLAIGAGILAIGAITGASMNLARTLGPEVALAFAGEPTAWSDFWVYLAGPAIGALGGAFAYDWISRRPATTRAAS